MSKLSSAQVKETQTMTFCMYAQEYTYLRLDGKIIFAESTRNGSNERHQKCVAPFKVKAGFHFIQVSSFKYYSGHGKDIKITSAKCKDDAQRSYVICWENNGNNCARPSDCEPQEDIKPKMSWPPVCGDAVKYKIDTSSADAVTYGTLGNTDTVAWK